MSADAVVTAHRLTKRYGGHRGIEDVSFAVERGEVFGFLGPNGAGKTTTIRTLLDLIRPTSGRASVFGLESRAGSVEIRRRTGYLPGDLSLYGRLTGGEVLAFLRNLRGGANAAEVTRLAERLDADLSRPIRTLSHGNRQKIGLIQAFMHRPELLLLDEPTIGLDPLVQHEVHRMIEETRADGRTVFLSSHVLPEVEALCDRVGIVRDGRLVAVEHIDALKAGALRRLEIHFAEPVREAEFARLPGIRDVEVRGAVLRCTVVGALDAVVKAAAAHEVVNFVSDEPTLEEVFLTFYGDVRDAP